MNKVKIEKIVYEGYGIGYSDKTIFIKYVLPNEIIEFETVKKKKNIIFAKKKQIIVSSEKRIKPKCPFFEKCGGCDYQHIKYNDQINIKIFQFNEILKRIGKIENIKIEMIKSPNQWHYRSSIILHTNKNNNLGFYNTDKKIMDVQQCSIADIQINKIITQIKSLFKNQNYSNFFCHIGIKSYNSNNQIVFIGNKQQLDNMKSKQKTFPNNWKSVVYNLSGKKGIYGKRNILLKGKLYWTIKINDLTFHILPDAFFQINIAQTINMIKYLHDFVKKNGITKIIDLYAGVGLWGMSIADLVNEIEILEINRNAIKSAQKIAQINGIQNVNYINSNADNYNFQTADMVILDPPRKGISEKLLNQLIKSKIKYIIYISCKAPTFARDLNKLINGGYHLKKITLFDMFPQTYHFESLAILTLAN